MKLSLLTFIITPIWCFSQWTNETINNGFESKLKVSVSEKNHKCFLQLNQANPIDEIRYITDTIYKTDTIITTKYYPEFPDGIKDTVINKLIDYKFAWKKVYGISLDLVGSFFCEKSPKVEIGLNVSGEYKKYYFNGSTFKNHKGIEISKNILSDKHFTADFEKASYILIRVNDYECEVEVFKFNMKGSKSAITFVSDN
jgi:hypothetical protein